MKHIWVVFCALLFALSLGAAEEKKDLATGEGIIVNPGDSNTFRFEPRYGYAYKGDVQGQKRIWLIMTDLEPSGIDWLAAKDKTETLRKWCEAKKASFVLAELDSAGIPQLVTQCPGNGALVVEMVSTINGLPSVQTFLEINDGKRLRGKMLGGSGSCDETYCEQTKEYYFDVTLSN